MSFRNRPLDGVKLAISASAAPLDAALGFSDREINRSVRRVAEAVLAHGAHVVFGHDWRPEGIMVEILRFALLYRPSGEIVSNNSALMTNFVPWPRPVFLSPEEMKRHREILHIVKMTEPDWNWYRLSDAILSQRMKEIHALRDMRERLTRESTATLCMGGKTTGYAGLCAGIVEEAALRLEAQQPVYLTGLFGGASLQVIEAISGRYIGELEAFKPAPDIADISGSFGQSHCERIASIFEETNRKRLSDLNYLTEKENQRLLEARNLTTVIDLVLKGLSRWKNEHRG